MAPNVKVYALSGCIHCAHAKELLDDEGVPYDCVHVDYLTGEERNEVMDTVRKLNPGMSFPTIVIGDKVIVGFRRDDILKAIEECGES